ncbi:MAG: acyl-CoA dehydrogenase family protein [Planctomycetota bacterium]
MDAFQELDYLSLDDSYTEEERMVRDTVRGWVSERFLPLVMEHWEAGTFPTELTPELAELGVFGSNLPEEYGCAGLNNRAYGLICQELERGDSGLRSFVSVQGALVMFPIFAFGSEEQKRHWLPKLASGQAIGCFGLTEPDFGSNPGGMISTCKRDGTDWILNGRKMWITNGTIADVGVFWAKDEEGRVRGFLVEKGMPGYTAPEQKHKWSLRCSVTSEMVCDDVRVPADSELPNTAGLKSPLTCLTQARYGIAWGGVGAALACFDEALQYSKERIVFDKPLASFQLVQKKLADCATDITLGQMMSLRLAELKERGELQHFHVSMGKRNNVAMALNTGRVLRDVLGANGITLEYGVGRHMCNLETVYTYEGTHDIHTLAIAERLTGIPAYR